MERLQKIQAFEIAATKILFQKNPKQEAWKKKVDRELFQYSLFKNAD